LGIAALYDYLLNGGVKPSGNAADYEIPEDPVGGTLLILGSLPYTGEAIDAWDCLDGSKLSCAALALPFATGRIAKLGKAAKLLCSFGGETRILMADGTSKVISEVGPGDMVWAQDPQTGEVGARKVTDAWVHDDDLVRLEVRVTLSVPPRITRSGATPSGNGSERTNWVWVTWS
jgi:hypothetical protein